VQVGMAEVICAQSQAIAFGYPIDGHPEIIPGQKSSSGRLPLMSPKPVSRAFADHDTDREGYLHSRAFLDTYPECLRMIGEPFDSGALNPRRNL
jgi:hypothetical protein